MRCFIVRAVALAALVAATVMVVPQPAHALVLRMGLPELSRAADAVVVAKVAGSAVRDGEKGKGRRPLPTTATRLQVTRVLAGERSQAVEIVQHGGVLDGVKLTVPDLPTFSPGETVVLFLSAQDGVVGAFQGKLAVEKGRIAGFDITITELERRVRDYRNGVDPDAAFDPPVASVDGLGLVSGATGSASVGALSVTALSTPTAVTISPSKQIAGMGRTVQIDGSGFGATQGTGKVQFVYGLSPMPAYDDGVGRAPVVSWSDTRIVVRVPQWASAGPVRITTAAGLVAYATYDVGFSTVGQRLPGPVSYRINENYPGVTGEGAEMVKAFDTWNAAGSLFSVTRASTDAVRTETTGQGNNQNEIWFAHLGTDGSLALNYLWSYVGGEYFESDIIINTAYTWRLSATSSAFDIQSVIVHEVGHAVGLDDQYPNYERAMGAAVGGQNRRTLALDEKVGAVFLHGQDPTQPTVAYPDVPSQPSVPVTSAPSASTFASDPAARLTPSYGGRALIAVRLRGADGAGLKNRSVHLEGPTGVRVGQLLQVTGSTGLYVVTAPMVRSRTVFTVRFPGDAANAPSSAQVAVKPRAYLARKVPTSARHRSRFSVTGTIKPAHSGAAVRVEVQKRGAGRTYKANSASKTIKTASTAVRTSLRLSRGTYRVRLVHSDAGHSRKATSWAYVRVR